MNKQRIVMAGTLIVLMLASTLAAAAQGNDPGMAGDAGDYTYSGDDAYDPAAGGTPERSVSSVNANPKRSVLAAAAGYSGDDDYDPAAGGKPGLSAVATLSGDDDYDIAAGGAPELSVVARPGRSAPGVAAGYSGDDDYDIAAGGTPELSLLASSEIAVRW